MALTWREATEAYFGGDRQSDLQDRLDREKEDGTGGPRDYYIHWATLCRHKRLKKVSVIPVKGPNMSNFGKTVKVPGIPLDPNKPPTAPFEGTGAVKGCDAKCTVCFPQFFPAQRIITDEEALEATSTLARGITDDFEYLQSILSTHADVMVQRWKKMSQQKRKGLLCSLSEPGNHGLCPEQPALVHLFNANAKYCDERFYRKFANQTGSEDSKAGWSADKCEFFTRYILSQLEPMRKEYEATIYLDSWLLPYLDIQTLSESPLPILSLLHCRTRYEPHRWALFDKMNIVGAEDVQIVGGQYNSHCISFHSDDYGALRKWDQSLAHREIIIGYNQGLYVLTAQGQMMNFLRKFVDRLICDIQERSRAGCQEDGAKQQDIGHQKQPSGNAGLDPVIDASTEPPRQQRWDQLVENGFSTFGLQPVVSWSSHTNQHLIAPPHADPVELHKKIQAAYQNAFDDIWAIQTDPCFVQREAKEFSSCLYFHFLDKKKEWDLICDEVILLPMRRELWWRETLKVAENMIKAYEAVKKDPTEDTQMKYDNAILTLWECCTEQLNHAIMEMKDSLPYQPGFEKNFRWEQRSNGKRKYPRIHVKDWFLEDPLFWSLDGFCNDRYRDFMCDPVVYLKVFDDQLRKASEKERRRVSPVIMRRVGDLAAIDEIRTAIQCTLGINRHAVQDFATKFSNDLDKIKEGSAAFIKVKNNLYFEKDGIPGAAFRHLQALCTQHPWPKGTPDATTLERTVGARDALADMWYQIRKKFRDVVRRKNVTSQFAVVCLQKWTLDQSEDYTILRREEEVEIRLALEGKLIPDGTIQSRVNVPDARQQQWLSDHNPESRNVKKKVLQDLSANKPKVKTQGEGFTTKSAQVLEDSLEVDLTQYVPVKKSSLSLLEHMFPLADMTMEGGKSWKWQHFVGVMLDAGFNITQGSGSAVSFEHPSGLGRIVFHQPHPQPIIDPIMLRSMGRRLRRSFGWGREIFVVRE